MKFLEAKQIAEIWGVSERRVTKLCSDGKITDAYKDGKIWRIPENAEKPVDGRVKNNVKENNIALPLPIGLSDFKAIEKDYYYVDKTLFIKDIIDSMPKVSLFTRPRRFGKTLNMDMLRVFFEISDEDTAEYFCDKKIWACGERYRNYQGKYPVIYLSFKDVKYETWEETLRKIKTLLQKEYGRHKNIIENNPIANNYEIDYFNSILDGTADEVALADALANLSKMLNDYYKIAPIIIIDEYDTPIQQGYLLDYYQKIILFMRNFFSGGFKDNSNITFGFMTGILRVAKESIFSGMNNLKENSILTERYSEYFGFTKEEVKKMFDYYGKADKLDEACQWYDGYKFGETEIFNPWSVINYLDENCTPKAYWQSTGNNDIIRQIVAEATDDVKDKLQVLMKGESIIIDVDTSVVYPEIKNEPLTIFSFLLVAGYLKITEKIMDQGGSIVYNVAIPNKEIAQVYGKEILSALNGGISQSTAFAIQRAMIQNDIPVLQKELQNYLLQTVSVFDTGEESFYQGLMLGLYAIMNNAYKVTSNRESGFGRFDIQMLPINKILPGIIVELKVFNTKKPLDDSAVSNELKSLAKKAILQINDMNYTQVLKESGVKKIVKIGMAFYKKQAEVAYEIE